MRVLGLDIGEVRIGVAVSDPMGSLAAPLTTIRASSRREAVEKIVGLVAENQVGHVVVGLPVSLNGGLGPQARKIEQFADILKARLSVPVSFWDESYSSTAAVALMNKTGVRRTQKKVKRDSVAAAIILQEYLDSLGRRSVTTETLLNG